MCSKESMPWYFGKFLESFRAYQEENRKIFNSFSLRIEALERATDGKHNEFSAQIERLREDMTHITSNHTLTDPCELLVTGVPSSPSVNAQSVAKVVLGALEAPELQNFVLDSREWLPGRTPVNSSRPEDSQSKCGFVFRFASPTIRDSIIARSKKLKKHDSQSLFNSGGNSKIYIRPLYPKPVFELLKAATKKSENLGYVRPVVRNMTVYVRETINSSVLPIHSEADLDALKPCEPPPIHTVM